MVYKLLELQGREGSIEIYGLTVEIPFEVAPKASATVWAVSGKTIVADRIDFNIDGLVRNEIRARISPSKAKPGQDVTFLVKTKDIKSQMMFLGVDKRVRLLKSGNVLTADDVLETLSEDNYNGNPVPIFRGGAVGLRIMPCWGRSIWGCFPFPGWGTSPEQVFSGSQMVIISNLETSYQPDYYYKTVIILNFV